MGLTCFSPFLVIGSEFMKYMDAFKPILITSLKNTAEYQVMNQPIIGARRYLIITQSPHETLLSITVIFLRPVLPLLE